MAGYKATPQIIRWCRRVILPSEPSGCWEWSGTHSKSGYGKFVLAKNKFCQAHRFGYERFIGPIPDGLQLDHLCRNRGCVNPVHLDPVTCRENLLRGVGPSAIFARQTHCHKGHPFSDSNTYRWKDGSRRCRECAKLTSREYRRKFPERIAATKARQKAKRTTAALDQLFRPVFL